MNLHRVCVSVVSHQQAQLAANLLRDMAAFCRDSVEVVLTLNVDEPLPFRTDEFGFPVQLIVNTRPRGFGANHNAAFGWCRGESFCVLNPDIRLAANPFLALDDELARGRAGVVAPRIVDPNGRTEDSARRFPTFISLAAKAIGRTRRLDYDYDVGSAPLSPDWVAGMFMLFRTAAFRAVRGFDERYFLYYEDVDICARLRMAGYDVRLVPEATATHEARRASRREWRYRAWHAQSALRFLLTARRTLL